MWNWFGIFVILPDVAGKVGYAYWSYDGVGGWSDSGGGADLVQMLGTTNGLAIIGVLDEGLVTEEGISVIFYGEVVLLLFCLHHKPNGVRIYSIAALVLEFGVIECLIFIPCRIILSLLEMVIAILKYFGGG